MRCQAAKVLCRATDLHTSLLDLQARYASLERTKGTLDSAATSLGWFP